MTESLRFGDIRIIGGKAEIANALICLRASGLVWSSKDKYYPQRGDEVKFAYYLNNVRGALLSVQNNDLPQPRPWDTVLGGQKD